MASRTAKLKAVSSTGTAGKGISPGHVCGPFTGFHTASHFGQVSSWIIMAVAYVIVVNATGILSHVFAAVQT